MEKYLTLKERISFTVATFGRSGVYTLMSSFLLIFYTDVAGLDPTHAGAIIVGCRIFDAINDPIMGMIVDRTHSKWGKMRPYLLVTPPVIAVATMLMFFAPQTDSYAFNLVYAFLTYLFWGICFTAQDIPHWGLASVITPLETERNGFLSTARLGSTFGGILPTVLIPVLRSSALGLKWGYFLSAVIFAGVGAILSEFAFFGTKERVEPTEKTPTLKETFSMVGKNKVLLLVVISSILGSTMVMANISASYVSTYLVTDTGIIPQNLIMTIMTVAIGVGMVPSMVFLPALRKKFDLKIIYIGAAVLGIVTHIACWFVGYGNIYVLLAMFVLMGVPLGIYNVISYAIIADSVDYLEWKTGERADGVCFSFQTLLSKVSAGIASLATSVVLVVCHYQEPINDIIQQQSDETRTGLFFMVTILPAIGFALAIIPMLFNDYTGEKKKQIQAELAERRAQLASK